MNWDLIGHEWAVSLLKRHIKNDRVRHAYLFTGARGVGRRTLAIRFTQALNCPHLTSDCEPCLECRTCQQIETMQFPDLEIVQSKQRGGVLKVDQIRELGHSLALSPYASQYKIAILLRFEEAHISASNALLKTLEEPAPKVVLIITAESGERLPSTIVSRCEVLRLRPVPVEQVAEGLRQKLGLSNEQSNLLAHISAGCPGYAIALHTDTEQMQQRIEWLNDHARLLVSSRVERFAYAEAKTMRRRKMKATQEDGQKDPIKETLMTLLSVWLSLWRDILLRGAGASAPIVNIDRIDEIEKLASGVGFGAAKSMVTAIERTIDMLNKNVNARLALEVLMLDLPATS